MSLLIVGLGNPGPKYAATRHNVGFRVLDTLARANQCRFHTSLTGNYRLARIAHAGRRAMLVKPLTFMNHSGTILPRLWRNTGLSTADMITVCDTLDLPPGAIRLRRGGGNAGHNGLASIINHAGSADFVRFYIGVGHPGRRNGVMRWVLSPPSGKALLALDRAVLQAVDALLALIAGKSPEQLMNEYNRTI